MSTPRGGTELLYGWLQQALPELTNHVQIILSRPDEVVREDDKPCVLWLHDLPTDPASAKLRDAGYRAQFNRIVFVSHWQQQQYNFVLGIPFSEGVVIKNAVPHFAPTLPKPRVEGDKLRFIYTSTPHRGLNIVAAAAEHLAKERSDWELHVYSSLKLYGWDEADAQFAPLYDALKANPNVVYHGSQPNDVVRQAVQDAHIFVYPSVYQETSCLAAIEALMGGCLAITTNYGALPETCGEWAWMLPFSERPEILAANTHRAMHQALNEYDSVQVQGALAVQTQYYQNYYSFSSRVPSWQALLQQVIAEGPKQEMLVID